jgi:3-oxoacyl-[acyl-carrier protein] reductase
MTSRRLEGQVALVTGASLGIGRATAVRLASEGADIVLNYYGAVDRTRKKGRAIEESVDEVKRQGVRALLWEADVSDKHAVTDMVRSAESEFGKIDVLINNAGVGLVGAGGVRASLVDIPEEVWDRTIAVNLKGQFLVAQATAKGMIERRSGKIVNVASELALIGSQNLTPYVASKAGVIGLTKAMARDLAPFGILVNCVAPGPTNTDMLGPEERTEEYVKGIPLARIGDPKDIAAAIYFLVSPDTNWATGQVFSPNGGTVM